MRELEEKYAMHQGVHWIWSLIHFALEFLYMLKATESIVQQVDRLFQDQVQIWCDYSKTVWVLPWQESKIGCSVGALTSGPSMKILCVGNTHRMVTRQSRE